MAKLCMIKRERKRKRFEEQHRSKRAKLRKIINDPNASLEEKEQAQKKMGLLPRDSAKIRQSNRCNITGRAHGVYRKVGLCRNMFRIFAMNGDIPGLTKASW